MELNWHNSCFYAKVRYFKPELRLVSSFCFRSRSGIKRKLPEWTWQRLLKEPGRFLQGHLWVPRKRAAS